MDQSALPMDLPTAQGPAATMPTRLGEARLRRPVRNQVEMIARDLDSMIGENHPVRSIWEFLDRLDLSAFYHSIRAVLDRPGRPASDPQVLLALWVYATVEGIGSARHLARLCEEHDAYRWLRGGVPVDYHLLADFRVKHQEVLDELLTQVLAVLLKAEVVQLKRVAQDGMRVRASAGQEAREQVERVAQVGEHPDPRVSQRERAARSRAARERQERVEEALRQLPEVKAAKGVRHRRSQACWEGPVGQSSGTAGLHHGPCGAKDEDVRRGLSTWL